MSPELKKSLSAVLLTLAVSLPAGATQIVEHADESHQQVSISAGEQNRLAIEGRRIAYVVPSRKGVLSVVKDERQGALYFALASDAPNAGTITLFVSDNKGVTYKLILVPQPIAGEEIILRPPPEKAPLASRPGGYEVSAASHQRRIKDFILRMADDGLRDTIEKISVNKVVPLWQEGRLVLLNKYLSGNLAGEQYILSNISRAPLRLTEQELYRRGVYAVVVERHRLSPGQSTNIFIVRERKLSE